MKIELWHLYIRHKKEYISYIQSQKKEDIQDFIDELFFVVGDVNEEGILLRFTYQEKLYTLEKLEPIPFEPFFMDLGQSLLSCKQEEHHELRDETYKFWIWQAFLQNKNPMFSKIIAEKIKEKRFEKILYEVEEIKEVIDTARKTERNENCPCGSGKKFKKCCAF